MYNGLVFSKSFLQSKPNNAKMRKKERKEKNNDVLLIKTKHDKRILCDHRSRPIKQKIFTFPLTKILKNSFNSKCIAIYFVWNDFSCYCCCTVVDCLLPFSTGFELNCIILFGFGFLLLKKWKKKKAWEMFKMHFVCIVQCTRKERMIHGVRCKFSFVRVRVCTYLWIYVICDSWHFILYLISILLFFFSLCSCWFDLNLCSHSPFKQSRYSIVSNCV